MKHIIKLVFAGLIPVACLFLLMNFISLNLIYSLIVGVISILVVSLWQSKNPLPPVLKIILLSLPLSLVYYSFVVSEINGLWFSIVLFFVTATIGLITTKRKSIIFSSTGLLISVCLISFFYLPWIISDSLSEEMNEVAPGFTIENLKGDNYFTNESVLGKVVVLDFFGTWCAPCIIEMKELAIVMEKLKNNQVY